MTTGFQSPPDKRWGSYHRQRDPEGCDLPKVVTPTARRQAVAHVCEAHDASERRACTALGLDRSTIRYRTRRPNDAGPRRAPAREVLIFVPRSASRPRSDNDKVGVGERQALGQRGELDSAARSIAVRVIDQCARCGIVDDAIVGIVCGRAIEELGRRERARARDLCEDRVLDLDGVGRDVKVDDGVLVARGVERRVEDEDVVAPSSCRCRDRRRAYRCPHCRRGCRCRRGR